MKKRTKVIIDNLFPGLFLIIICCPHLTAQQPGTFIDHPGLALPASHDTTPLRRFLKQYREMSYEEKGMCTDTIHFAHENRWFFNINPPFLPLDNGYWAIGYTGSDPAVYLYRADGSFVKKVTGQGQGPGEITGAVTLAKQHENFYISEGDQRKILCFANDGKFLRELPRARTWGAKTFVVSPTSRRYYYYSIIGNPDTHLFTMGDLDRGMIKEFGDIDPVNNIAMLAGPIHGITCDDNGYFFVIKPAEYGIDIFQEPDRYLGRATAKPPKFFQPPPDKEIKKIKRNNRYSIELFFNNMHTEKIYYLGRHILLVTYTKATLTDGSRITFDVIAKGLQTRENKKLRFLTYLEFWQTDGTRLGHSRLTGKYPGVAYAENGYLYYWEQQEELDEDGLYPNPALLRYDLWKELGWR